MRPSPAIPRRCRRVDFQTAINLLKVDASELAVETVMNAMRATGLSGYRNDTRCLHRPGAARRAVLAHHDQQ